MRKHSKVDINKSLNNVINLIDINELSNNISKTKPLIFRSYNSNPISIIIQYNTDTAEEIDIFNLELFVCVVD